MKALGLASKQPPLTKSAPYFLEIDTAFAELGQSAIEIDGLQVIVRRQFLDFVELSGWLLLLIGYFVLFILEAGRAK